MHTYVSAVSLCQRCGRALLYDSGLRVSCEFSVDSSSSADSTAVGDFAFTMTQSHDYPQKALASHHIDLCIDHLKCSPEMTTGFSQLQCLLALLWHNTPQLLLFSSLEGSDCGSHVRVWTYPLSSEGRRTVESMNPSYKLRHTPDNPFFLTFSFRNKNS